jgi:hypothetical protein
MRVFGVDGEKMKESNPTEAGWHDIFMNNAPILELRDVSHHEIHVCNNLA